MNSMRRSLVAAVSAVSAAVVLAVGLVAGVAGVAVGPAAAAGGGGGGLPPQYPPPGGQTGTGSSSGGTFTANVAEHITQGGDYYPGFNETWSPPECWLQPEFLQPQTYQVADPTGGPSDAASYYFWFGSHYRSFEGILGHVQGARYEILQEFKQEQDMQRPAAWTGPDPIESNDQWWAPNWLNSSAGWACAQALVVDSNLSDGFIGMQTPATPGAGTDGQISSQQLAGLARASLRLPTLKIVTSPRVTTEVNVPTYVSVEYLGDGGVINPNDTATVDFGDAPWLTATVQATLSSVQITSNAPASSYHTTGAGTPGQSCAAANGTAIAGCSITFEAPSANTAPWSIKVSATWTVTWTTSAADGGTFPPAPRTGTTNVVVREITSQT
jgi:hypothetical protein